MRCCQRMKAWCASWAWMALSGCAAFLLSGGTASGEETAESRQLRERVERLEKQNQELMELLKSRNVLPVSGVEPDLSEKDKKEVKDLISKVLKENDDKKKKDEEEKKKKAQEEGYVVGSDTKMSGSWSNGLIFQSENKDFRVHVGGRLDFDSVFWRQPHDLQGPPPGGNLGVTQPGTSGLGKLDDGSFFRRARLQMDGTAYETVEWNLETCFEGLNNIFFDEFWFGMKELPLLGTVRVGQFKTPLGLESYSSSKLLPLLERSVLFDAFWQEFTAGIYATNNYLDQHATLHFAFGKPQVYQNANGEVFGDGN